MDCDDEALQLKGIESVGAQWSAIMKLLLHSKVDNSLEQGNTIFT